MFRNYTQLKLIADRAQDLFDNRLGWSEGRGPYAPKDLWLKLEKALYGPDKPDPHVVTEELQADGSSTTLTVEDDEIVKLADKLLYEHSLEGSRKALKPVFRLIQAGIQKNKQGIEEVDKRRYMDSKRISEHYQELDTLKTKIEGVQEHLDEHNSDFVSNNMDHEDLERKVEELETRVKNTNINLDGHCQRPLECVHGHRFRDIKPQAKGGVALDKEGMPHDLIPGRSVVETPNVEMVFLYKNRYGNFVGYTSKEPQVEYKRARRSEDGTWVAIPSDVTWVFDLPSCGDEGTIPGGDK